MPGQLKWAILALTQPATVQFDFFPDFVGTANELALCFEDGLYELNVVAEEGRLRFDTPSTSITRDQQFALENLNQLLMSRSGEQHRKFWSDDALKSDAAWDEIRDLAKIVATAFGWDVDRPPPSDSVYVRAG